MAGSVKAFKPVDVEHLETTYRRIVTPIPVPESAPIIETLWKYEPRSMRGLTPVLWDRAEGFQVYDRYGNRWIDFTSGIVVANSGHAHPHIRAALKRIVDAGMLHSYLFATEIRAQLVKKLVEITPENLTKGFLLSTGAEAIECAVKISRLYGLAREPKKKAIVSFAGSFHGRTMGAQMMCSVPEPKAWITPLHPDYHQIPFPRCSACPRGRSGYAECGEECFLQAMEALESTGVKAEEIAAFMVEGYQGVRGPMFFPNDYARALRRWADEYGALVLVDEIQSGFGRTGKLFAYQHYGIDADIVCCGKGISSGMPLSAVLGRGDVMDIPGPGDMSSTHTGNPVCCAATLASIEVLEQENLVAESARKGKVLGAELLRMQQRHASRVQMVTGRGLVYGLFLVEPATGNPDVELGDRVVERAIGKGVMLFVTGNGSIKICPPLGIPDDALIEGVQALEDALDECVAP